MPSKVDYNCRVCGYRQDDPPWGDDGKVPTFDICSCCGVEFGYEDSTLTGVKKFREEWVKNGGVWFEKKSKPDDWKLESQLKNIHAQWK